MTKLRSTSEEPFWCEVEAVVVVLREVQEGVDVQCTSVTCQLELVLVCYLVVSLVGSSGRGEDD